VHGRLDADVTVQNDGIVVDGRHITISAIKDPAELPWQKKGVEIVAECTGLFRDRHSASKHLISGARKIIISAPATDADTTIVMGVNNSQYDSRNHHIVSNASCTTNCLSPVAKVLNENFGILNGLMTTIHSYTGDQRLLDFPHKDLRRARSAALSMIPTSTGAAKAVAMVLPDLAGKLNGLAIRVPTPNVSLVDFTATLDKAATVSDINGALKEASQGELKGILGFSDLALVSMDFNGCPLSSVVDGPTTYVAGNMVKVLAWYDNETGYSTRMVDLASMMAKQL
jgi:glyceraldehyde 3-phosphate dehydrogenase